MDWAHEQRDNARDAIIEMTPSLLGYITTSKRKGKKGNWAYAPRAPSIFTGKK